MEENNRKSKSAFEAVLRDYCRLLILILVVGGMCCCKREVITRGQANLIWKTEEETSGSGAGCLSPDRGSKGDRSY